MVIRKKTFVSYLPCIPWFSTKQLVSSVIFMPKECILCPKYFMLQGNSLLSSTLVILMLLEQKYFIYPKTLKLDRFNYKLVVKISHLYYQYLKISHLYYQYLKISLHGLKIIHSWQCIIRSQEKKTFPRLLIVTDKVIKSLKSKVYG